MTRDLAYKLRHDSNGRSYSNSKERYTYMLKTRCQNKMSGKNTIALFVPMMVLGLLVATFDASQFDSSTCYDCCVRANNVFQKADTTPVRRDLCNCFKVVYIPLLGVPQ